MLIRKATRRKAKLRLALCGVSGAGKTLGAIKIAKGMGGKIVVIDTEDTSADLYANIADYDVLTLTAPFSPQRYVEAIEICEKAGYDIIIIDSLSQAWAGTGGVLDIQDKIAQTSNSKNTYFAWREATPLHNRLVDAILHSPAHIIVTMRSKAHHDVVDINGKKTPVKVGMAPIQREGMDYEFTVVLDIDQKSHLYNTTKDRTQLFDGKHELISEQTGKDLMEWLNSGKSDDEYKGEILSLIDNAFEQSKSADDLRIKFQDFYKTYPQFQQDIIDLKDKYKNISSQPVNNAQLAH